MRERLPDHHETGTFADRTHDGDARLIAAAPELLAALQSLQSFVAVMIGRGPDAEIPDTIPTPLGVPVKIGDVESAKTAAQADYEARIRSAPTSPASGDEYCPTILHLGVEVGDPHWQFVERDVPTVAGQVFAANVEKLTDFDGNLVGFKIFEPSPASGGRDDDLTTLVQKSIAAFAKLSSEEQEARLKAQRESWARGERGIGSDKDEAEARAAYRAKASGELDAPRCCIMSPQEHTPSALTGGEAPQQPLMLREIETSLERQPCPSCSARNVFLTHTVMNNDARQHVECRICSMRGPVKYSEVEAVDAWNKLPRVEADGLAAAEMDHLSRILSALTPGYALRLGKGEAMTSEAKDDLVAQLKPVAWRAVKALRYSLGWTVLADTLSEYITAAASLAEQVRELTRERDEQRVMFLYEADKHSEWLEKFMDMKRRAEAAEAREKRLREALEWYAGRANYNPYSDDRRYPPKVLLDGGDRARAALESKE